LICCTREDGWLTSFSSVSAGCIVWPVLYAAVVESTIDLYDTSLNLCEATKKDDIDDGLCVIKGDGIDDELRGESGLYDVYGLSNEFGGDKRTLLVSQSSFLPSLNCLEKVMVAGIDTTEELEERLDSDEIEFTPVDAYVDEVSPCDLTFISVCVHQLKPALLSSSIDEDFNVRSDFFSFS